MEQLTADKALLLMKNEILRLRKLLEDNGINPNPTQGAVASLKVTSDVKVFKTKEEAEEYQKKILSAK